MNKRGSWAGPVRTCRRPCLLLQRWVTSSGATRCARALLCNVSPAPSSPSDAPAVSIDARGVEKSCVRRSEACGRPCSFRDSATKFVETPATRNPSVAAPHAARSVFLAMLHAPVLSLGRCAQRPCQSLGSISSAFPCAPCKVLRSRPSPGSVLHRAVYGPGSSAARRGRSVRVEAAAKPGGMAGVNRVLALDFDGVVCDSVGESALSAWRVRCSRACLERDSSLYHELHPAQFPRSSRVPPRFTPAIAAQAGEALWPDLFKKASAVEKARRGAARRRCCRSQCSEQTGTPTAVVTLPCSALRWRLQPAERCFALGGLAARSRCVPAWAARRLSRTQTPRRFPLPNPCFLSGFSAPPRVVEEMRVVRPVVETGYENIVQARVVADIRTAAISSRDTLCSFLSLPGLGRFSLFL